MDHVYSRVDGEEVPAEVTLGIRGEYIEQLDRKTTDTIFIHEGVNSDSDALTTSESSLSGHKYGDDDDENEIGLDAPDNLSRHELLPPVDYQQMEFEPSNDFDKSLPLHRRIAGYAKKSFGNGGGSSKRNCFGTFMLVVGVSLLIFLGAVLGAVGFGKWNGGFGRSKMEVEVRVGGRCATTEHWKGWDGMKYSFVFGDSWSTTSFNHNGHQPTPSEPLGNPDFPGHTSSNSTNWITQLTTKYNSSLLLTHNLAVGGTTLDNHINLAYPGALTDVMYDRFMPTYADAYLAPWKPQDTLFIMFIGINDCMVTNHIHDDDVNAEIDRNLTLQHTKLLHSLYGVGARNFLLLNLPPLERTYQPSYVKQSNIDKYATDVSISNRRLEKVAKGMKFGFGDVNVFHYDLHALFNSALDDPRRYEQTRGILNTTGYCPGYAHGGPTNDFFLPECRIPVNQYFWLNGLHPTYPIHDVLAEKVSKLLERGPNVC